MKERVGALVGAALPKNPPRVPSPAVGGVVKAAGVGAMEKMDSLPEPAPEGPWKLLPLS